MLIPGIHFSPGHVCRYYCFILFIILLLLPSPVQAQNDDALSRGSVRGNKSDSLRYDFNVHATLSSGENTPFWLVSNLQGLGSPEKNNGFVRAGLFKDIDCSRRFSWGAGVDLIGAWRNYAPFQVHQLYGEVKYRALGLILGSKEMWDDANDPRLSSGSMLFSGNAIPIPQLRFGILNYVPFPKAEKWLNIKGYIAFGMFTDSGWQKDWAAKDSRRTEKVLYHSKGLWLRFGDSKRKPLEGEFGVEMATQFGGTAYKNGEKLHLGHGLLDWLRAFIPIYIHKDTFLGDERSVDGNMLGQYTFALKYAPLHSDWSIRAYYEHFFEDESMMFLEYGPWKDCLVGIEATLPKNRFVSKVVFEYIYTKDQSSAVFNNSSESVPEQISGRDNYYNHSVYTGWQHWGMGIGNPLLISPIYNANKEIWFETTRIIGYHLGIGGNPTSSTDYRILLSYTDNWGTYFRPYPHIMSNFNALVEVNWFPKKLKGWYAGLGLAFDRGDLLGNSLGVGVTIGKTGFIRF